MNHSHSETRGFGCSKALHIAVFVVSMVSFMLNGSNAHASNVMASDYRFAVADGKFADTRQFAVAFKIRPPRRLRARRLELAVGTLSTSHENRLFVSLGPVWRLPIRSRSLFFDLGISPTLLNVSSFNGRDMGGNFHFTSSVGIGANFGARDSVALSLRSQHISNGSLRNTNPGMDMIGLNFTFSPSNR